MMKLVQGGVTAPIGYFATGIACGLKKDNQLDLSIVCSEDMAVAAGVFTQNTVKGHSLQLTMKNIKNGYANALVINSGNANACNGSEGYEDACEIAETVAQMMDLEPEDILVGSTGVIGKPLDMDKIRPGLDELISNMNPEGGHEAALAIMTTDTFAKEISLQTQINGKTVTIGGMAKGSGMIHPNMATLIGVITTDANISKSVLQKVLSSCTEKTFNRTSVDGDTSVCDMVISLANGMAENEKIDENSKAYDEFYQAYLHVCTELAKMIAKDGEGATKLIEVRVNGAKSSEDAKKAAFAIAKSPLVKTAMFGQDANWGRIITALGYSGADFDPNKTDIHIGDLLVCKSGEAVAFDETHALEILKSDEILLSVKLNEGKFGDRVWTCDFSFDYVKINASYRS
ncbi:MAG TPA: ornithine acetyltransferase [Clostridiales bacterium]|nr:ornithine acetyltransferase [Clostridiales bacterium]